MQCQKSMSLLSFPENHIFSGTIKLRFALFYKNVSHLAYRNMTLARIVYMRTMCINMIFLRARVTVLKACYRLDRAIVANQPIQIEIVTCHETDIDRVYM